MISVVRPGHEPLERGVDLLLDLHVDRRRGVVEHEDRRVDQQRAGDRDALALAARERVAALADDRVVALGQLPDEVVGAGRGRGRDDLVERRVGPAVGDVVADRHREQERLVEHHADVVAQARQREVAHVVAVDAHRAVGHVVEAREQPRRPWTCRCRCARRARPSRPVAGAGRSRRAPACRSA